MKELKFLEIINKTLSKNSHIGDDCAYLDELGIVVTQDSLVEDIHFSQKFSTPYQLAYKAIAVNLSDIFASGALPKYFTISLSLPNTTDEEFINDFYKACNELAEKYGFEIIGGDLTGGEKLFISVCAIGITKGRNISGRSYAMADDYIITSGVHGSSAAGLWLLKNKSEFTNNYKDIIQTHLFPIPQENLSRELSTKISGKYAMMDSSDGLADALCKIAASSGVEIEIDFDKIPYDKKIEGIAALAKTDFKDWIFYGGEDFQLIASVSENELQKLDKSLYTVIGRVKKQTDNNKNQVIVKVKEQNFELSLENTYNHFSGENQ